MDIDEVTRIAKLARAIIDVGGNGEGAGEDAKYLTTVVTWAATHLPGAHGVWQQAYHSSLVLTEDGDTVAFVGEVNTASFAADCALLALFESKYVNHDGRDHAG